MPAPQSPPESGLEKCQSLPQIMPATPMETGSLIHGAHPTDTKMKQPQHSLSSVLKKLKGLPPLITSTSSDSEAHVHAILHPLHTEIELDLSSPQFTIRSTYSAEHWSAPATNPPVTFFMLRLSRLALFVPIAPTTTSYVSVNDVLRGLYIALRQPLGPELQKMVPKTKAWSRHGGEILLYVDLLLGFTMFAGLERCIQDGSWEVMVS